MARFPSNRFSLSFVDETSYGVLPGSPTWTTNALVSTRPEITKGRDIEDLNLSVESDFTVQPRVVGSRHGGTFTFNVPLRSQVDGYTVASSLSQNPELILLEDLIGTKHTGAANAASDVVGTPTATSIDFTATEPDEGAYIYTGTNGSTAITSSGWGTDTTSPTPFTVTLFEDAFGLAVATNDAFGTYTLYSDDSQPTSKSFFFRSPLAEHGLYLLGCIPTGATVTLVNGKVVGIDYTYMFDGWEYDTSVGAGLIDASEFVRLPPMMGVNGGRVTFDGGSTGTADPTGTCGIGELSVEITTEVRSNPCHGAPQGYSGIDILGRNATVTCTKPWEGADITGGQSKWDDSLENGTTFSFMAQTGIKVGQAFSLFIPTAVITDQPQISDSDGAQVWSLQFQPDSGYSGDTGTTAPANSSFRIAVG
jgi:hypothetical protein